MDKNSLIKALKSGNIIWRRHALERMLERGINRKEVKEAIEFGEIIEEYKDDKPFESVLIHYSSKKTLHVVLSLDEKSSCIFVITVYEPDTLHFEDDLKTRREL